MERLIFLIFILFHLFTLYTGEARELRGKKIYKFPFYIFSYRIKESPFVLSGYAGDVNSMRVERVKDRLTGKVCIRIIYIPERKKRSKGWAGLWWQFPANNWGNNKKGGYDLTDARYLYFSARGGKGGEIIRVKIGGIKGKYGDSDDISTEYISLQPFWRIYKIELENRDLKNIIGGFAIFFSSVVNSFKTIVYLNEIFYSKKDLPENKKWLNLIKKDKKDKSELPGGMR